MDETPLDVLRRWESSGGTWRVVVRTPGRLVLELATCDAGEVMGRVEAAPPDDDLVAHVAEREGDVSPGGS
jgi:hypothetical protein